MATPPVNEHARALFLEHLRDDDRILILGAAGWFGSTALALLRDQTHPLMLVALHSRNIVVGSETYFVKTWDENRARSFEPTVVFDFAFLTVTRSSRYDAATFRALNRESIRRLQIVLAFSSVRQLVAVSSGAVLDKVDAAGSGGARVSYANEKLEMERSLQALAPSVSPKILVIRVWSVSGAFVRDFSAYALSSMVWQAKTTKRVVVRAPNLVFRRYCAVEEVIAVALAEGDKSSQPYVALDSGGEIVEIGELAAAVAAQFGSSVNVGFDHRDRTEIRPDRYMAQGRDWENLAQRLRLNLIGIDQQIVNVIAGSDGWRLLH